MIKTMSFVFVPPSQQGFHNEGHSKHYVIRVNIKSLQRVFFSFLSLFQYPHIFIQIDFVSPDSLQSSNEIYFFA